MASEPSEYGSDSVDGFFVDALPDPGGPPAGRLTGAGDIFARVVGADNRADPAGARVGAAGSDENSFRVTNSLFASNLHYLTQQQLDELRVERERQQRRIASLLNRISDLTTELELAHSTAEQLGFDQLLTPGRDNELSSGLSRILNGANEQAREVISDADNYAANLVAQSQKLAALHAADAAESQRAATQVLEEAHEQAARAIARSRSDVEQIIANAHADAEAITNSATVALASAQAQQETALSRLAEIEEEAETILSRARTQARRITDLAELDAIERVREADAASRAAEDSKERVVLLLSQLLDHIDVDPPLDPRVPVEIHSSDSVDLADGRHDEDEAGPAAAAG